MAKSEEVRSFRGARFVGVEPPSEEEGITDKVVVEIVVDQLP
jgi:hypothetical protein